jgi:two-component system response regulator
MIAEEVEVLYVEDDMADQELTMRALRKEGLANRIQIANDGEEALDFLFCRGAFSYRSFERPPRLILLDLKLPKVGGLDVLREIQLDPRTKTIPVVVLTSSVEQRDLIESYQLGINSYLQKPVDFDNFREMIRQVGMYWLVVNRPPPVKTLAIKSEGQLAELNPQPSSRNPPG